jgi:hypothetical protein
MKTCFVQAAGTIELYFYDELDAAARRETERHLNSCRECRQALDELEVIRAALLTRPDVAAPAGGDWTPFMARLDGAIRQESGSRTLVAPPRAAAAGAGSRQYVVYIAMAALLALVTMSVGLIVRSRLASNQPGPSTIAGAGAAEPAPWTDDEAFAALSEQHFERAKLVVFGLANKQAGERMPSEWQYERELASTLLVDTRLYRLAAEDRGMKPLAKLLGDLELVLLQASMSQDPQPDTLAEIQNLIRKRDLVTRMNVMAAR